MYYSNIIITLKKIPCPFELFKKILYELIENAISNIETLNLTFTHMF